MRHTLLIILSLLVVTKLSATKIIVSQDGSGDYTTIQSAAIQAQAGDTILIHAGTYNEKVIPPNSGDLQSPIVYMGKTGEDIIIDVNGSKGYCIQVDSKNNLVFKNITVKGALWVGLEITGSSSNIVLDDIEATENDNPSEGNNAYGIHIHGDGVIVENITIKNSEIHHNDRFGIYVTNQVHNVLIDNCHVHSNGTVREDRTDNILLANWNNNENGPQNIEIRNCEINNSTRQGILAWYASNIWIHDCYIHDNGATAIQIEDGVSNFVVEDNILASNQKYFSTETGIWVDDSSFGIVKNNIIKHNEAGIKVSKSNYVIVRNNVVFKNHEPNTELSESRGISFLAYEGTNNTNIATIHNTFHDIGNAAEGFSNAMVAFKSYGSETTTEMNNIFLYNNIFSGIVNGYYMNFKAPEGHTTTFYSDNNCIYDDEGLRVSWDWIPESWEDYVNRGYETNPIMAYPEFNDTTNNNYTLAKSSPCIDQGRFLTKTVATGSGKNIAVENAVFFNDGYGMTTGDRIKIGTNDIVEIQEIDYSNNIITIDKNISWQENDNLSFEYVGTAPDVGAFEDGLSLSDVTYYTQASENNLNIKISPNPFRYSTTIHFKLDYDSDVRIEIINSLGNIITKFDFECLANHNYEAEWKANNQIPAGFYSARLITSKELVTKKIMCLKN